MKILQRNYIYTTHKDTEPNKGENIVPIVDQNGGSSRSQYRHSAIYIRFTLYANRAEICRQNEIFISSMIRGERVFNLRLR